MATEERDPGPRNLMEDLLGRVKQMYREEHGEEPPEEFIEEARRRIVLEAAEQDRNEHREIYDKLADE
jgi:hypothetical protein